MNSGVFKWLDYKKIRINRDGMTSQDIYSSNQQALNIVNAILSMNLGVKSLYLLLQQYTLNCIPYEKWGNSTHPEFKSSSTFNTLYSIPTSFRLLPSWLVCCFPYSNALLWLKLAKFFCIAIVNNNNTGFIWINQHIRITKKR